MVFNNLLKKLGGQICWKNLVAICVEDFEEKMGGKILKKFGWNMMLKNLLKKLGGQIC